MGLIDVVGDGPVAVGTASFTDFVEKRIGGVTEKFSAALKEDSSEIAHRMRT